MRLYADIIQPRGLRTGAPLKSRHCLLMVCLLLLALHGSAAQARAQVSKEYQIKAVLLFRLAQFVEWPTNRFATPTNAVVIGVIGKNPFGEALSLAVRGETAHNRSIKIEELKPEDDIRACHIVFISRSEARRVKEITSSLAGQSVLTVSDMDNFVVRHGGMVRFLTDQNKVNLRINLDTAKAAGLVLDSRLLRMAEIMKSE
jgi:YfiR/HmsC-like